MQAPTADHRKPSTLNRFPAMMAVPGAVPMSPSGTPVGSPGNVFASNCVFCLWGQSYWQESRGLGSIIACMYVSMYACIPACMHARTHACMRARVCVCVCERETSSRLRVCLSWCAHARVGVGVVMISIKMNMDVVHDGETDADEDEDVDFHKIVPMTVRWLSRAGSQLSGR